MVGAGVLVCGDCVVLGPHRGRPVVPLAALAARQNDAHRLAAAAKEQAEQHAEAQRRAARVAAAAAALAGNIAAGMQHSNPLHVLTALQRLRGEKALQHLMEELGEKVEVKEEGHPPSRGMAGTRYEGSKSNGNNGGAPVEMPLNRGHSNNNNNNNNSVLLSSQIPEVRATPTNCATNSLYAKYLAAASATAEEQEEAENQQQKQQHYQQQQHTSRPGEDTWKHSNHYNTNEYGNNSNNNNNNNNADDESYPKKYGDSSNGGSRVPNTMPGEKTRLAKEDVTYGWHLYRQGDTEGARRVWTAAHEQHMDDAVGARARAYIAEAVERDYEAATAWYTVSLQRDPHDAMTMCNYACFFERAYALGDAAAAAGRRAQQLRAALKSN
ncbi:hypothetical protein LSM04_005905 [Trypanosoma melophagium]|uniref:uncharacterized protein n=1 Tax=Trypanosoma melophagium TaxID=715481 RepID=UPI003519EF88|nr:hypothetical protein LSM04_005905 [Trypanosoma melophagium]